ncbi:hypothetical protein [Endozoicomonas euniceicola]|uniref:Tetratricopeptide repeat protein n=1 Tax=Endozoicomonas euniceicola TaxID=1234143 RepID=A0ABY6GSN8_9GAMM|nr:hypothetical protein [Endozoicomonas euniceicola]UYM15777.1 hypothetical protein NX720_23610 [Endozoicomonas euniceicola]
MDNKNRFVRCCYILLSISLMLAAYEVKGGFSHHSFILLTSGQPINAISVKRAGVSHRAFSLSEGENFIIAEEVRLNRPVAQVHISGTNYLTDYLLLTSGGRASVAADPNAIEQAEALHFSPCLSNETEGTVGTLLSDIATTNSVPYGQQPCDRRQAPLPGTLYINPSITRLTSESAEGSFTPTDDILVLTFSNTGKGIEELGIIDGQRMEGRVLENGSYRLMVRIGLFEEPFKFTLPQSLIFNPVASYYSPAPTPTDPEPEKRFIPPVKNSGSEQPEADPEKERTDADIAMVVYFCPDQSSRSGSATHTENHAETEIIFIQRSGAATNTESNHPNETKAAPETISVAFAPFAMYSDVRTATQKRSENQKAPEVKTRFTNTKDMIVDVVTTLKNLQPKMSNVENEQVDDAMKNPEDIRLLVNNTRQLIQLRSNYIASAKITDRKLINSVDKILMNSRILLICFLHTLDSEAFVTRGGLKGSDVLPVQLLAELCDGLKPTQSKLNIFEQDEYKFILTLKDIRLYVLGLILKVVDKYNEKEPDFNKAVAYAWQDLRKIIAFIAKNNIIDLDSNLEVSASWQIKVLLSLVASEMGDIETVLLLMQLTKKQLANAGRRSLSEIQDIFDMTLRILVDTLNQVEVEVEVDLASTLFSSFLKSAEVLKLDTSLLEAVIKRRQQQREHAQTKKSQKINQKADLWAEKEKRMSDKIRQKRQEAKKEAQRLRKKRHQSAKQHGKKTEPHSPTLSTATASDLPSEKNTIEPGNRLPLYEQGEQAFTEERYDEALEHFQNELLITSDPLQRARIMSSIADCYFFQGNFASRLSNQLTKAYDYYEDAERAAQSGNFPELDKDGFFKLACSIIDAIDDKLIESIRQAYRWHVEAIDELQKLKGEEEDSEVEELLSLLIIEAENQEELARSIKDGVTTLNKASELRRQAINNKKPDQRPSQRKEEQKVLDQLSHLQEKVTSQPIKGKGKGKKKRKRQTTQKENPDTTLDIEAELEKLKTGGAACQQELYDVLGKFSESAEKAREIKRNRKQKAQHSETPAPEAPASGGSELSSPAGLHHYLEQSQLNELLSSSGIIGFNAVDVPSNHWCMFEALERWLNLFPDRDDLVNNPTEGSELFYALGSRAKLMADENQDDQMLNQIAATFHVDAPGPQAWGTDEMLHRLIAPVLNLNILVLAVDFSEDRPVLTSAMYTRDAITPVPPEERNSAINRSDTIALLHINNHWQAVLPAAGFVQPASTGGNTTEPIENESIPLAGEPGLQGLEISPPEVPVSLPL